jgi:ABC-type transporter Mla maintaining outer membrane lipid asymmetry ATPase subunit MlaF
MGGSAGAAVALRGATLAFGQHVIWENLDLDVAPGECLAILGANGTGKTTLLKVMLGLLPLSAGTITIDGRPPGRLVHLVAGLVRSARCASWTAGSPAGW